MSRLTRVHKGDILFVFGIALFWRLLLFLPELLSKDILTQRQGYIGEIPWANFDGTHYLSIAKDGYFQYEHVFFPLFPLLIRHIEKLLRITYLESSLLIVYISFLAALFFLYKLSMLDLDREKARWVLVMLLAFPTSFFLASVYTESLFLALSIASFYAARKKRWVVAGILGGLASSTRFVGIFLFAAFILEFLYQNGNKESVVSKMKGIAMHAWGVFLIPLALLLHMYYLHRTVGDAFAFIHSQFAFGANRSSGEIVLLPQVLFRYANILLTLPISNYDFWIAFFELVIFSLFLFFLITRIRTMRISYLVYSFFVVIIPTLSGTLSSEPRYVLAAFPVFLSLSQYVSQQKKIVIVVLSSFLLFLLTMFFLQGYFIA